MAPKEVCRYVSLSRSDFLRATNAANIAPHFVRRFGLIRKCEETQRLLAPLRGLKRNG